MKAKLSSLDSMRALACIGIFTFHSYLSMLGSWAVSAFIMLSGFVLSYNGVDRLDKLPASLKDCAVYALKKIGKLYPLYFITLLVVVLRLFILAPEAMDRSQLRDLAETFVLCSLLLQSWIPKSYLTFALNGVGWYLSTTLLLYFAFPFIIRGISKIKSPKKLAWLLLGLYVLMLALVAVFGLGSWAVYIFPPYRLLDFTIGCVLGYMFTLRIAWDTGKIKASIIELLGFVLAYVGTWIFTYNYLPGGFSANAVFVIPNAMLLYSFALNKGVISHILDCKPLKLISDYSAEIFLIHPVVILYVTPLVSLLPLSPGVNKVVFVSLAISVTIIAAVLYRRFGRRFPFFAVK